MQGRADAHATAGPASPAAPAVPKVLFVSSHSQPGGSERVLEDLLGAVPPAAVAGVVALQDGPLVQRLVGAGRAVVVLPTGPSPQAMAASALRLARVLRRTRPQVVHANGVKAALVAVAAAAAEAPMRPVPVVWMKHDVTLDGPVGRLLARRCAAVPCVSSEVQRSLRTAGRSLVVHPGVDVDQQDAAQQGAALRHRLGLDGPVVSVVGRLDPAKGHGELLEALPALAAAVPGVQALLVGGDDPQHPGVAERLRQRAAELDVAERVHLVGHLPSPAVLGASDVVCVPTVPRQDGSGREGFGLVAAEALLLGVPVVGYDVGATGEVLDGCGALVAPGDRTALAREVARLLSDREAAARATECGQRRGRALSVGRMAEELLTVYAAARR